MNLHTDLLSHVVDRHQDVEFLSENKRLYSWWLSQIHVFKKLYPLASNTSLFFVNKIRKDKIIIKKNVLLSNKT